MGKCIIKLDDKFMHWSSVTDAPESPLLAESLFQNYWYAEYGRSGWVDYANMIEEARKKGCSARGYTVNEIINSNHAGTNGRKMTKEQIIKAYTCESPEEFLEWSRMRDTSFQKMVVDFGPLEKRPKKKSAS